MKSSIHRLGQRWLALTALAYLPIASTWAPPLQGAPALTSEDVLSLARAAYSGASERLTRYSFSYRSLPVFGSLPADAALTSLGTLLEGSDESSLTTAYTHEQWSRVCDRAGRAWGNPLASGASEFVRVVTRYGNIYLDIDEALLNGRVERPTAGCEYRSAELSLKWSPLTKQLLLGHGGIDIGVRPNTYYFLSPPALAVGGMHTTSKMSATPTGDGGWTVSMSNGRREYRYSVHPGIHWLPREATRVVDGRVVERGVFRWFMADKLGIFPALVANVTLSGSLSTGGIRLACFSKPTVPGEPPPKFRVPHQTKLVDTREEAPRVVVLGSATDVEPELSSIFSLDGELNIPQEVLDMCKPVDGERPPSVIRTR